MGAARALIERRVELYNDGDLDQLLAMYTDDALEITPDGPHEGRDAIARRLRAERVAFPDMRVTPVIWVEESNRVVVEYSWTATHTGPLNFPNGTYIPATGKELAVAVVSIFQLRKGKISAHRIYLNRLLAALAIGEVSIDLSRVRSY